MVSRGLSTFVYLRMELLSGGIRMYKRDMDEICTACCCVFTEENPEVKGLHFNCCMECANWYEHMEKANIKDIGVIYNRKTQKRSDQIARLQKIAGENEMTIFDEKVSKKHYISTFKTEEGYSDSWYYVYGSWEEK